MCNVSVLYEYTDPFLLNFMMMLIMYSAVSL